MSSAQEDSGLLFVYGECGSDVTEEEFNDWYDNEHAPARLALPGISTGFRYKAPDGTTPSWLAIYDTTTPEYLQKDAYKSLSINASEREKSIVSRLAILNRRIYTRIATLEKPGFDAAADLPAKALLVTGRQPASPEGEEDLNRWYTEEHFVLLAKVPGFLRARRYKLVSQIELAGKADVNPPSVAYPYLAVYEFDHEAFRDDPAFKAAVSTAWTAKVNSQTAGSEKRLFVLHKSFSK
ncbi:hypothetical protein DXG03_003440 [Asterophora parasitica]|uniref:Uncharacterized protein n=1 Tax=Asterophora parasitica TaxID=117018 RepID=A0A9P7G809_9AGAR|nr:hypothetical protein DXG03_003440 [Asterophora parasitica]